MSGPKISEYGLTKEQRAILRQQLNCLRVTQAAVYAVKQLGRELCRRLHDIEAMCKRVNYMRQTGVANEAVIAELDQLAFMLASDCIKLTNEAAACKLPRISRHRLDAATVEKFEQKMTQARAVKNEILALQKKVEKALADADEMFARYMDKLTQAMFGDVETEDRHDKPHICAHSFDYSHIRLPERGEEQPANNALADLKQFLYEQLKDLGAVLD